MNIAPPTHLRRAYELGRVRVAAKRAAPLLVFVTLALCWLGSTRGALLGAGLFVASTAVWWRGGQTALGVRVGVFLGAIPFFAAQLAPALGHACGADACGSWCMPACAAAGLAAGALGGHFLRAQGGSLSSWWVAMGLTVGIGTMSCHCFGGSSTVALAIAWTVSSLPHLRALRAAS